MGITLDTVNKQGNKSLTLPIVVMIQLDNIYAGPNFCSEKPRCIPIISERSESDLYGSLQERQQLSVKLAWGNNNT